MINKELQKRGYPNATDASATSARSSGSNNASDLRALGALASGRWETGTANTVVTGPTPMEFRVHGDLSGHFFICLGFMEESAHRFVFKKMMTWPDTFFVLMKRELSILWTLLTSLGEDYAGSMLPNFRNGTSSWSCILSIRQTRQAVP